jgi:hypothetical protein
MFHQLGQLVVHYKAYQASYIISSGFIKIFNLCFPVNQCVVAILLTYTERANFWPNSLAMKKLRMRTWLAGMPIQACFF